jgi:hypothetical protein
VDPEPPDVRDASVGAPLYFLHFDDEDVALEAAVALLHKGYRVEITPPSWDVSQWHLAAAGVPKDGSAEDAYESLREWAILLGGGSSGAQFEPDADDVFGE